MPRHRLGSRDRWPKLPRQVSISSPFPFPSLVFAQPPCSGSAVVVGAAADVAPPAPLADCISRCLPSPPSVVSFEPSPPPSSSSSCPPPSFRSLHLAPAPERRFSVPRFRFWFFKRHVRRFLPPTALSSPPLALSGRASPVSCTFVPVVVIIW